jgi:hypothetical protein
MRIISTNYNLLDCLCWSLKEEEYCAYCAAVCEASLEDFECGVGDWLILGESGE